MFTCPDCGITSHNPRDEIEMYCGRCRQYKTTRYLCLDCEQWGAAAPDSAEATCNNCQSLRMIPEEAVIAALAEQNPVHVSSVLESGDGTQTRN